MAATDTRPEVAPVRPGEELDWPALEAYLRRELPSAGLEVTGPMSVAQFPNGHANLTYLVTFATRALRWSCAALRWAGSHPARTT